MSFRAVHRLSTYLMVLAALGALSFGGNLDGLVLVIVLVAMALSAVIPEERTQSALWQSTWTVATFAALGLCVLEFFLRSELVLATVNFLLFLLVNKLFNRKTGRDYLHLYVITLMMVIAASVLNIGISFALWLTLYIVATTWSLILFHLRREMEENYLIKHSTDQRSERVAVDRILNSRRIVGGWFLLGTSTMSLTVVILAVGVFLFFPRIGGLASFPQGASPQILTGFSDRLTLGGHGRLRDNPDVVLRVHLRSLPPGVAISSLRYRGATFDVYARGRWIRSGDAPRPRVMREGRHLAFMWDPLPGAPAPDPQYLARRLRRATRQEVFQEPTGTNVLFSAGQPLAIDLREKSGLSSPGFRVDAGGELRANLQGKAVRYVIYADLASPSRAALAAAPSGPLPQGISTHYLTPRDEIPSAVRRLGTRLARGKPNALAKVDAVLAHLRQGFRYSRRLPNTGDADPIAHFLLEGRAGHCEYFASAMVLLLRAGGVPARVVTGFLGGAWNQYGEYVAVRQGDAHAWVEVWFPGHGWVTFDPTPSVGLEPLAGNGFLHRMQMLLDSMRMRWQRWVIEYDVHEQMVLFDSMRKGLGHLRQRAGKALEGRSLWISLAVIASAAGFMALVLFVVRRRRRIPEDPRQPQGPRGPTLRLTRRIAILLRALSRLGLTRRPGETILELAERLDAALPGLSPSAEELVRTYYRLRYSGASPDQAAVVALEQGSDDLLRALRARREELRARSGIG